GRFTIAPEFPASGLYHIYVDGIPAGIGQQVFRFELPVSGGRAVGRTLAPSGRTVNAGPYAVTLASTTISSKKEAEIAVHVTQSGAPARNLQPYLGALAHAVFLNAKDLSYVHVHPAPPGTSGSMPGMDMAHMQMQSSGPSSPDMELHVELKEGGTYKLWLQ